MHSLAAGAAAGASATAGVTTVLVDGIGAAAGFSTSAVGKGSSGGATLVNVVGTEMGAAAAAAADSVAGSAATAVFSLSCLMLTYGFM
uniref:Putative secreted protein n=1 Tax=Anopheles darlingi TaxID=43151 RepID=A0A2M4DK48_ANODA